MKDLLRCVACGNYTLKEQCDCGGAAQTPKPAKYSPEDKYASYRRKARQEMQKEVRV